MSEISIKKSVVIQEGREAFVNKSAIERFKNDIRENNQDKIKKGNYFYFGWSHEIISDNDKECVIRIRKNDVKSDKKDNSENRQILRMKLKQMQEDRKNPHQIKTAMRDKVPEDVLGAYMEIKRNKNIRMPVPNPMEVLTKQEEYRQVIHTTVQSFGLFRGTNNPIVNYFRLLAKHLGLPTHYVPPQQPQQESQSNPFLEELKKQRESQVSTEVDDEMKKIYESLGIEVPQEEKKPEEEIDDEMKKIYESLGIQMNE
jgi:hypothetical protein